jgi:protoporphyrinogen oxidase
MRVVVAGAGIAGLAAATHAKERGHEVLVLEATERVGGRAVTHLRARTGDRCDVGTQYYHSSYRRALALMRRVGLSGELSKIRGRTRFFDPAAKGGSYLLDHRLPWIAPAGLAGNLRVAGFLLHRLLRHRIDPFALEDRPALDAQSALAVVREPWAREVLLRACHLAGALSEPEETDPSLLHLVRLLRIILLTDYLALPGGVASLHERLASELPVRLEAPAERLAVEGERVAGVALAGTGEVVRADHVVVATPAPRAAPLLPEEWKEEREFLAGVRMVPAQVVTFFLDRPLERGVWSYMTRRGSTRHVSFWVDAAQKNPAMVPSGRGVLQAWVCAPASRELAEEPDSALVQACLGETDAHFPGVSAWVEEAHVQRHALALPQHPVGHQTRALRFLASAEPRAGVSFCGDYLSGGYLEPALWSAERAVARLGAAR